MDVLITGGAGYLGTALTQVLHEDDSISKITVLDNLHLQNYSFFTAYKFNKQKVAFVEGDILNNRLVNQLVQKHDAVVHLASIAIQRPFTSDAGHAFEQVNHWGTSQVCDACEMYDKKIIYLAPCTYIDENNSNFEKVSKIRGKNQVERTKNHCIISIGEVFGANKILYPKGLINTWVTDAVIKNKIEVPGNGRHSLNIISLSQTLSILSHAIKGYISGSYEAGSYYLQVLDVLELMQKVFESIEFVFVNPHLQLAGEEALKKSYPTNYEDIPLETLLAKFKNDLCFY